jgi:diguanylate cyclase (GGDEF)-like protein
VLPRILTPDEFHQAKQLPPEALAKNPFPVLPPLAPSDATRRLNPNAGAPDQDLSEQAGQALRNSSIGKSKGLGGILVRQVAAPIVEHPFLTAATGVATAAYPPLGAVWLGMMGKDVVEYAAQKAAEKSLDPDTQAIIANDPQYQASRISGEQAGTEAAMLGLSAVGGVAARMSAGKPPIPSIGEATQPIREQVADFIAPGLAAERRGLAREANTDALTGLGNQRAFRSALPAAEQDPNTSIIRFDANGFKAINDTHGHDVGDEVLARIGRSVREHAKDLPVFRTGGDEFAVFAPSDQAPAIRDAIEQGVGVHDVAGEGGVSARYSISGGVGNTNAEADAAAMTRKVEHKAAQGIAGRGGETFAANVAPPGEGEAAASGTKTPAAPAAPSMSPALQNAVQQHVANVSSAIEEIAPVDQAKAILRANLGDAAANYEQAALKVDEFRRAIDWLPENDKLGFVDAIEHGDSQPTKEFQPLADVMRNALDGVRDQIRAEGTGKLEKYITDYFPHSGIWADPEKAALTFKQLVGGRRPMEGTKSFLKKRTIATVMDGVRNGAQLAEGWNPIDVFLSNYRDMQRYLFAIRSMREAKEAGIMKYVRAGEQAPDGYTRINDKIATVFGKPTVTITEAFDRNQRAGIMRAIKELGGVAVERSVKLNARGLPPGTLGYAQGTSKIAAKFGTHDGVLMHELGHIIDNRYGVGAELTKVRNGKKELAALADLRAESNPKVDPSFRAYLQKPEEQAANALHAYLHAPERMKEVAPHVYKGLDRILQSRPELKAIRDIKPSVELGTSEAEVPVGGMVIRGQYWAPKEVATVFNNHLSPGLPQILRETWGPQWGNKAAHAFELYRGLGNVLNQAQLGFSAFHLGMTSLDASVSRAALGLEEAAAGNVGAAVKNVVTAPLAAVPGVVQGTIGDFANHVLGTDIQMGLGAKIRQAYLNPEKASPEMLQLAQYVREAGGRVVQDSFYKTSAADQFMSAMRESIRSLSEGDVANAFSSSVRAGKVALPGLLEAAAKPIMEHIVPLQKLQVFGELAQKAVRDLPPDATLADRRLALQQVWDSVDNRMGQLVYDNLFWNRTFKDLAMASTRSVGWNLGTIRELGGGYLDLAKGASDVAKGESIQNALTHRAAYAIALPAMIGLYGAMYQYLRTGEGPGELKDYFYPQTGELDADGNSERVELPSYMKDLAAYAGSPWQTVTHKIAPLPNLIYEMLQNQDFYGDEIRNPLDPAVKQIQQEAEFIAKSALPFSYRNTSEQNKRGAQSDATKFGNWFGVTPAPRREVRSEAQNLMNDLLSTKGPSGATPEQAAVRDERAALLRSFRGVTDIDVDQVQRALESGSLTPPDIVKLLKRAGMTPAQEKFKRLSLSDALEVFDQSSDREKALFAEALSKKLGNAGKVAAK